MNNTATHSTTNNSPCPTVRKQIGKTTYIVRVHFSETAKETMEDKDVYKRQPLRYGTMRRCRKSLLLSA